MTKLETRENVKKKTITILPSIDKEITKMAKSYNISASKIIEIALKKFMAEENK